MTLLLDTGAVFAYYVADDRWHASMRAAIDEESGELVLPAPVIPEVDHLLGVRVGRAAREAFYADIVEGVYLVVDLDPERYAEVRDLNMQFADLDLGFVDAAIAALSRQLGVRRLATSDRRHFPAIAGVVPLELVPAESPAS
ncbi:MAG: type II toxin-antitoxin system VapC family toxin [Sporichthyaceae bacterium]